jgi:hypothetical protein
VGDPRATGARVYDAFRRYLKAARYEPGDHLIVASNPCTVREFAFRVDVPCNVHACKGEDGADTMLLSFAEPDFVAGRYDRVAIGSGDGVFAMLAHAAERRGVDVLVVARAEGCARSLRRFGHVFIDGGHVLGDAA